MAAAAATPSRRRHTDAASTALDLSPHSKSEVDELDGWLRRLEALQCAQPPKASLPSSPREGRQARPRPHPQSPGPYLIQDEQQRDQQQDLPRLHSEQEVPQDQHGSERSVVVQLDKAETAADDPDAEEVQAFTSISGARAYNTARDKTVAEASPRPTSTLDPTLRHEGPLRLDPQHHVLRRYRSKSLSDKPGASSSKPTARIAQAPDVHGSSDTHATATSPSHAGSVRRAPHFKDVIGYQQHQQERSDQTASTPSSFGRSLSRAHKKRAKPIPPPLPIQLFFGFGSARSGKDRADDSDTEEERFTSCASDTEGDQTIIEGRRPGVDSCSSDFEPPSPLLASPTSTQSTHNRSPSCPALAPSSPSAIHWQTSSTRPRRKLRRMTAPQAGPSSPASTSGRPATAGAVGSTGGSFAAVKYQARSPFASPGSPEWRRRNFPRAPSSSYDSDEDVPLAEAASAKARERGLTAAQILAELGSVDPGDLAVGEGGSPVKAEASSGNTSPGFVRRFRKSSRESSIGSIAAAVKASASHSKEASGASTGSGAFVSRDSRRESVDSRASRSSLATPLSFLGGVSRSSKQHSQMQSTVVPPAQASPSGSSTYSTQQAAAISGQPRKPKLQARDDRPRPAARPRFPSTRSTSSLPLHDEEQRSPYHRNSTSSSAPRASKDSLSLARLADGVSMYVSSKRSSGSSDDIANNPRRASIPNVSQLYASASSARANRASLAVPPAFNRSYSYDDASAARDQAAALGVSTSAADARSSLEQPHLRELAHAILLWFPADASAGRSALSAHASASSGPASGSGGGVYGHGRALTKVLLGNVPSRKKITKRDSVHGLLAGTGGPDGRGEERKDGKGKEKERSKDKYPSTLLPAGQWRTCEAVLKPNGQLALFSENVYVTSIAVTSLQRTDIRPADPSLLGKHRVLALHVHGSAYTALPFSSGLSQERRPQTASSSHFPTSPSAPDFGTFAFGSQHRTNTMERPSTAVSASSAKNANGKTAFSLDRDGLRPDTLYLAFPNVVSYQTWITALQNHARAEVYPALSRFPANHVGRPVEEEVSSSEGDDSILASPERRNRFSGGEGSGHAGWRPARRPSDNSFAECPLRFSRSINLQVIECRGPREHSPANGSYPLSYAALAGLTASASGVSIASPPTQPQPLPNPILEIKRTASIASGSAASTEESEDSASVAGHSSTHTAGSPLSPSMPSATALSSLASGVGTASGVLQGKKPSSVNELKRIADEAAKEKRERSHDSDRIFCEVWQDDEVLARTALKKAAYPAVWQESFAFANLGPYHSALTIRLFQTHRNASTPLANVEIPLKSFRRNAKVQEWFPITTLLESGKVPEIAGEMSLGLQVREDIVLPLSAYEDLEQVLTDDVAANCLHSLAEAHSQLSLEELASLLLRVDLGHDRVLARLTAMCEREIQACDCDAAILFRGNSLFTKSVELYLRTVGSDFLESAIGRIVRKICDERVEIEIDPSKVADREKISENVRELQRWTSAVWEAIYNARHQCPSDVRRLFRKIQQHTERYFEREHDAGRLGHLQESERSKIKFTCISAFIFLRFFGPAILNPRLFGLCVAYPSDARCQRTLTLIAKVLQGLANMSSFGGKEPWMGAMNPFLQANISSFEDFITHLCGKPDSTREENTSKGFALYAAPRAVRSQLAPAILKEGVPNLPFLIDLPRELAVMAALVASTQAADGLFSSGASNGRPRTAKSSVATDADGETLHARLIEVCCAVQNRTRARLRSLDRMGELAGSGRPGANQTGRMLVARIEGGGPSARQNSTRTRGTTVSVRSNYTSSVSSVTSPSSTMENTTLGSVSSTPPRGTNLYSSSPASNASVSPEQDILHTLSPHSDKVGRTKRRSHTISVANAFGISASPSHATQEGSFSPPGPGDGSPASLASAASRRMPPTPLRDNGRVVGGGDDDDGDSVLEIHMPTSDSGAATPAAMAPYRRTTVTARPKNPPPPLFSASSAGMTSSVPLPEPKTPRAIPSNPPMTAVSMSSVSGSFLEMQQSMAAKGIEHEIAAQELGNGDAGSPVAKQRRGLFGRRK